MGVLHVFDMDGTLLAGTTASLQVAQALGRLEELVALEATFAAGEIDTRAFAAALYVLWHDLTPAVVAGAFSSSPWLAGIERVCADIRDRGERSVVITMSPDFFARHLLDWGFDEVIASRYPALPFTEPIDLSGILTPHDKVRIVRDLCTRYADQASRCVAYGDSMSDEPLFRYLGAAGAPNAATVAINADEHLSGLAGIDYRGNDLTEAYRLARELLTSTGSVTGGLADVAPGL